MDINNITGLEKPLTKLIETVAQGIGVLGNTYFEFDSKKIKRVGRAEAESERMKIVERANAETDVQEILLRAQTRFALEQYNKQVNLENTIVGSYEMLTGEEVTSEPVSVDWITRFMQVAQDVSREDIQKILSQILAGEIKEPDTFSFKTLDFIKNLNKQNISLMEKFSPYISHGDKVFVSKFSADEGFAKIEYHELIDAMELGIIQPTLSSSINSRNITKGAIVRLEFYSKEYHFEAVENIDTLSLPILTLTKTGKELLPLLFDTKNISNDFDFYISELTEFYKSKKLVPKIVQ